MKGETEDARLPGLTNTYQSFHSMPKVDAPRNRKMIWIPLGRMGKLTQGTDLRLPVSPEKIAFEGVKVPSGQFPDPVEDRPTLLEERKRKPCFAHG